MIQKPEEQSASVPKYDPILILNRGVADIRARRVAQDDIDNIDSASYGSLANSEGVDDVGDLRFYYRVARPLQKVGGLVHQIVHWNEKKTEKEAGGSEVQGPPGPGSASAIHGTARSSTPLPVPPYRNYRTKQNLTDHGFATPQQYLHPVPDPWSQL